MTLDIEFYTDSKYRELIPEPVPAYKKYPEWYNKLDLVPKNIVSEDTFNIYQESSGGNVKRCHGITDFLKTGYIIPAWTDLFFRETDEGNLYVNWFNQSFDFNNHYTHHGDDQFHTMKEKPMYGGYHKLSSPWKIKTSPGVSYLVLDPFWHNKKSFYTVPGIVHGDQLTMHMEWLFEWNYKITSGMSVEDANAEKQIIGVGEPLIMIVPFLRKAFKSHVNYVDSDEIERMRKIKHMTTKDTAVSKCPYIKFKQTIGNLFR